MKKLLLFLLLSPFIMLAQDFWTEVTPFSTNNNYSVNQISIANNNIVWVHGNDTTNFNSFEKWSRSVDGGITWTEGNIDLGVSNVNVGSIHAVSATTAYVSVFSTISGVEGGVWITADSGATWTKQPTASFNAIDSFANFIHFFDTQNGVVVGDPVNGYFEIYTTADGGNLWTRVPEANLPAIQVNEYAYTLNYQTKDNVMWFTTNKGRIFKSIDAGIHWSVSNGPVSNFDVFDLAFKSEIEGIVTGQGGIWKTFDGGVTWQSYNLMGDQTYLRDSSVYVPQTNNTYFCWGRNEAGALPTFPATVDGASYSTNGGFSWINLNDADQNPVYPESIKFQSGTVAFCIGSYTNNPSSGLKFFRLTDPLNRLGNSHFETNSKISMSPNPTDGILKITGSTISSIRVFEITGKEIYTQSYNNAEEVSLNISTLNTGIYIAKIIDVNGNSTNQKIIKK
jgi:photosystem II stability/assembly factor-like uncharacterized protein